jgi:hypothetical protein
VNSEAKESYVASQTGSGYEQGPSPTHSSSGYEQVPSPTHSVSGHDSFRVRHVNCISLYLI